MIYGAKETWIQITVLSLNGYIVLNKSLSFSEPRFLHLPNGVNHTCPAGRGGGGRGQSTGWRKVWKGYCTKLVDCKVLTPSMFLDLKTRDIVGFMRTGQFILLRDKLVSQDFRCWALSVSSETQPAIFNLLYSPKRILFSMPSLMIQYN